GPTMNAHAASMNATVFARAPATTCSTSLYGRSREIRSRDPGGARTRCAARAQHVACETPGSPGTSLAAGRAALLRLGIGTSRAVIRARPGWTAAHRLATRG